MTSGMIRQQIGGELRRIRQRKGLGLVAAGCLANVSPGYLSEVERGQKWPSWEVLEAICEALELSLTVHLHPGKPQLDR